MKSLKHLLYLVIISPALLAQGAAPLLIEVDSLSKHLNDRNLVILEVGEKSAYDAKHVPGAHYVSLQDLSTGADFSGPMSHKPGELMLELLPADVLRAKLSSFGISDDSQIVVYSDSDRHFPFATRVIFTLQYVGLGDHTSLLNGGMSAWTKGGKPTTDKVETVAPGKLTAQPTKNIVADADMVRSIPKRPGYKLVDARAPAFYKGVDSSFDKAGHIPGAVNIPFSDVIGSDSKIDVDHLTQEFRDAGIKPGDTVITYCHVGAQATATLFAARLLGHPVMLYDGSWQDWTMNNRGSIEK